MRITPFIFAVTLILGCQTHRCPSERVRLAMRNPSLEGKWTELYLTSIAAEELRFAERIETRQLWHKEMEKYRDDVAAWDERVKIGDAHQREPFEKAKKFVGP